MRSWIPPPGQCFGSPMQFRPPHWFQCSTAMPNVCNGSGSTIDPTRSDGRLSANSGGNLLSGAMLAWMTAARRSVNVQRQRESQHRTLTAARLSSSPPRMPPAAPQTARRTPVQTREIVPHHRVGHLRSRSGQDTQTVRLHAVEDNLRRIGRTGRRICNETTRSLRQHWPG